jgi:ParB-like chromosome segregation protein Spo0J
VRPKPTGRYELVAGERRVRAARLAGLHELPFVVRTLDDLEAKQARAIENLARGDELAWETARSYEDLLHVARLRRKNAGAGIVARLGGRHGRSEVSRYLRIARRLTRDLMERAGALSPDVLPALSVEVLDPIAKLPTDVERCAALGSVVATIRQAATMDTVNAGQDRADAEGCAAPPTRDQALRRPTRTPRSFSEAMDNGGFRKTIRPPVKSLGEDQAAEHLTDLLPMIAALGARTMRKGPEVQRLDVSGSPIEVWLVTKAARINTSHDRLAASVPALRQLRTLIDRVLRRAEQR